MLTCAPQPGEPIIRFAGVARHYGTGPARVAALRDIHAEVRAGAWTVLAGASGSGKTTLLNLAGGLDRADAGQVLIAGLDLQALSERQLSEMRRRWVGVVFQTFNLLPTLTALENVEFPLALNGVPAAARTRLAERALEEVGLAGHGRKRPAQLSGGQRQRVAIARALVKEPLLVLADEPTANLDSETGRDILALLRTLQQHRQVTLVVASHDPKVLALADAAIHLKDGRQVEPAATGTCTVADRPPYPSCPDPDRLQSPSTAFLGL